MRSIVAIATTVALCASPSLARAESVYVKYRGEVDLKSFDCTEIVRSSFITRMLRPAQRIHADRTEWHVLPLLRD